ncbi:hypothetical protein LINPERPRIM_LOCUS33848, partial [Linum perenne]
MAGTIQTLSFGLPSSQRPRLLFRHLTTPPAIHLPRHSNSSFSFNCSSSVRVPSLIRACQPPNQASGNGNEPDRSSGLAKGMGSQDYSCFHFSSPSAGMTKPNINPCPSSSSPTTYTTPGETKTSNASKNQQKHKPLPLENPIPARQTNKTKQQ